MDVEVPEEKEMVNGWEMEGAGRHIYLWKYLGIQEIIVWVLSTSRELGPNGLK